MDAFITQCAVPELCLHDPERLDRAHVPRLDEKLVRAPGCGLVLIGRRRRATSTQFRGDGIRTFAVLPGQPCPVPAGLYQFFAGSPASI